MEEEKVPGRRERLTNGENSSGDFVGYFLENSSGDRVKVAV